MLHLMLKISNMHVFMYLKPFKYAVKHVLQIFFLRFNQEK